MAGEWTITHSDEVTKWYNSLRGKDSTRAKEAFDYLKENGPNARMPNARSLGQGLFELRFKCQNVNTRVTYHQNGQEFRTLTVFRKQRQNERNHVERARLQMKQDRARLDKSAERTQGGNDRASGQNRQRMRERDARERGVQRHGKNKQQTRSR